MRARLLPIGLRTLAFVGVLILAELLLYHVGNYGKWVVQDADRHLGWTMLPDQRGWSRDYDVPEIINGRGFRDRDWLEPEDAAARTDVFRVAVVGNSITYGSGVLVEQTWPRVLEDLLASELARRGDPRRVVVMNFAVQGYVFEQMARVFEAEIEAYRPDLLVVPNLAPDIRPMRPARSSPDYRFRELVLRTALYDMLRDRVIDKWIPPPGQDVPEATPMDRKRDQLARALPAMHARFFELHGGAPPPFEPLAPESLAVEGEALAYPESLWQRVEQELWRNVLKAKPGQVPKAVWDVCEAEPVRAAGEQLGVDLRLELFLAFEDNLSEFIWSLVDGPVMNTPWTPNNQFWWWKMAARLEGLQERLDAFGGRLSIVTVTRLHEVLDENLPEDQQTVKPVHLFWERWLPEQAERIEAGKLFYTYTRPEFARMQPAVTQALIQFGYLEGPRGTKRIDPNLPGVEQSLFLENDVGHFSPRGHAAFAELLARSLVEQGLFDL